MTKIENALIFATKAHAGKYRKGTDRSYIIHPIEVMSIVMHFTDDEDVLTAAVLHDTVEDNSVLAQRTRLVRPVRFLCTVGFAKPRVPPSSGD